MAKRPVFYLQNGLVVQQMVEFEWFPGFSASQKKKSILSLHQNLPEGEALEVSTKSLETLGVRLSAFSLKLKGKALESIFQGSKVFEHGGPFTRLYDLSPRDAKHAEVLHASGLLKGFSYSGEEWELTPKTAFYDYIYLNAVKECLSDEELEMLKKYKFFTDIEFNPQKSINTQARAIVIVKLLLEKYGKIPEFSKEEWIKFHQEHVKC